MKGLARTAILFALAASAPGSPPAWADSELVQLGVRGGYAFGGGLFLGPTLSVDFPFVDVGRGAFGLGVATSAFVMLGPGSVSGPTFGMTLGPELALFVACPAMLFPASAGGLLTLGPRHPLHVSGYGAFTATVSTRPSRSAYGDVADRYSNFFGAQYLFLVPALGVHVHEVGGAWIRPYVPGRASRALGDCGGN